MTPFGARLSAAFAATGHLCVGIDPHPFLLEAWGLPDSAQGLRDFGLRVVDAAGAGAGILKPQVAFFERHGSRGYAALEDVIAAARAAGLIVIADAKRGDVGTSVEAYGQAWLTPGSPLEADALTVSAFQGVGSLAAPAELASAGGKGLFVLCATSNPESIAGQTAVLDRGEQSGSTVSASIVAEVKRWNREPLGSVGVVIGATVMVNDYGVTAADLAATPILAPGFGHQGARFGSIRSLYGAAFRNVIVSSSRAILGAGPSGIAAAVAGQATELSEVFAE
jgi:orotidine-5'-phosphate decarboxylase